MGACRRVHVKQSGAVWHVMPECLTVKHGCNCSVAQSWGACMAAHIPATPLQTHKTLEAMMMVVHMAVTPCIAQALLFPGAASQNATHNSYAQQPRRRFEGESV